MVLQNIRSEVKGSSETQACLVEQGREGIHFQNKLTKPKLCCKVVAGLFVVFLIILNVTVMYLALNKNTTVKHLEDEVKRLRNDVDFMKKDRFWDEDIVDEIKQFENEDDNTYEDPETVTSNDNIFPSWEDYDFDDNYDEENSNNENYDSVTTKHLRSPKVKTFETSSGDVSRNKREVLAATIDGVPIIAESYAERKLRNKTFAASGEGLKLYESLGKTNGDHSQQRKHHRAFQTGWTARTYVNNGHGQRLPGAAPTPVMSRASRVMHTDEDKSKAFRKVVKKSLLKSGSSAIDDKSYQEQVLGPEMTVSRDSSGTVMHRRRKHGGRSNLETLDERHGRGRRTLPAAHFAGDASKYVYGQHQHYDGNSRLRHPDGLYVDWTASKWVKDLGMERSFHMHNGVVTIKDSGLYFIYAQIYYLDEHDMNGYRIYRNDSMIAQCTTMTHSEKKLVKGNTCYTATVEYLTEGDRISLKDIENMRYSLFEDGKSFFGLVKINDVKIK